MIAVLIVRQVHDAWIIDTWLQSCRILERGVEQTLMNLLIRRPARAWRESMGSTDHRAQWHREKLLP